MADARRVLARFGSSGARLLSGVTIALLIAGVGDPIAALAPQARPSDTLPNAAPNTQNRFKIVIIEGENAVNIIQQRTAVTPVVEVRDRNDQPVAGVLVRFAISRGNASFNGARSLSVTTNIAGRAAATGFTPTGAGALQISASAAVQGQTAVATIVQTNVMTAAQAAGAAAAGGAGGSGGTTAGAGTGGAAGSGGGVSATTIGVVAGAVAGGTVTATQLTADDSTTYSGPFSAPWIRTVVNASDGGGACTVPELTEGTVTIQLNQAEPTVTGTGRIDFTQSVLAGSTCSGVTLGSFTLHYSDAPITGTAAAMVFNIRESRNVPVQGVTVTVTDTFTFSGSLPGDSIAGTLTVGNQEVGPTRVSTSSVNTPVTLQRR